MLPQEGIPVHISMIEYFTRFRDDILQHAKPTCFEELTVFHLLSYMGKKGYENGIGVMSAEERTAAGKKGYENRIAKGDKWEEQYAVFEVYDGMPERGSTLYKRQKNQLARFDAMVEKEIAANDGSTIWEKRKTKLFARIAKKENDKWEKQYAVFEVYDGMPERGSAL